MLEFAIFIGVVAIMVFYAWLLWWIVGRPLVLRRERKRFVRAVIGALGVDRISADDRAERVEKHYSNFANAAGRLRFAVSPLPIMLETVLYELDQGTRRVERRYGAEVAPQAGQRIQGLIDTIRDRLVSGASTVRLSAEPSPSRSGVRQAGGGRTTSAETQSLPGHTGIGGDTRDSAVDLGRLEERLNEQSDERRAAEHRHRQQLIVQWAAIAVSLMVGIAGVIATLVT